ncbi:MAG: helix-turn-helix transcriptional regulator, partial [Muribaculaceae bacterium]|nr:helix-turn-helix transcriptional regulator [Muribaculaceae bacterium]
IVEEHLSDIDFDVETLSNELGLSRGHLYKKFMAIIGIGPSAFIRSIRLKRGRELLSQSQMRISEIAYAVGFNTPKRFSVCFKEEYGMTPTEYLESLK